jgi:hypothetical protein
MNLAFNLGLLLTLLGCSISADAFQRAEQGWIRPSAKRASSSFSGTLYAANNNVVLRPSEATEAFDSFKVGGARIHRYSREKDMDSETQYVMWYHGRSVGQDEDKSLPPISTGRIGRATSRNGLSWKKETVGSLSEDSADCSLGLNKESWWGFDTAHVGLGNVLLPMTTPAIMTEGGVYMMYYMGGSFDETPIADYIDKEMPADAKIKGMKMKIGVCISQDGMNWGRVEGDDSTGACMIPYDKEDPNFEMGFMIDEESLELNIKEELYTAWPDVVVNLFEGDPDKSGFFMFYSTMTKDGKQKSIAYAISKDGFRWFKRGICMEPEEGTMDADGCARCNVVRNAVFDGETSTWSDADGYIMFYEGVSKKDGKHRIMKAESVDGANWSKFGVVLDVGESDDAWDCEGVGSPHVLRMDDGSQRMYYTGQGPGGSTAIGVAKLDMDANTWMREQASITFAES